MFARAITSLDLVSGWGQRHDKAFRRDGHVRCDRGSEGRGQRRGDPWSGPLLVKGEPGTGKTILAQEIAGALGVPLIQWHIKSTTKAQQGLYEYDAVARLRDSQLGEARVHDIANYIVKGRLWEGFTADVRAVLLIDEIDKADIEFPNDLLLELDRMEFFVYETKETIVARHRPIVIITSNNEKELPDAFLRRCFFHYIRFPDRETMESIVDVHFPGIHKRLLHDALTRVLRDPRGPRAQEKAVDVGTARLAQAAAGRGRAGGSPAQRRRPQADPAAARRPHKNEQDIHLFERLAFLHRREGS